MTWEERIVIDPAVATGKPIVRGTRMTVEFILGLMAEGWSQEEILDNYPQLAREDLLAALAYAQETLSSEKVYPLRAKSA